MITVFVGDVAEYLSNIASREDNLAQLITSDNYKNLNDGTYYTSVGDLNHLTHLSHIFHQADIIKYVPPTQWSDQKKNTSVMKFWTEKYLENFFTVKNIHGFVPVLPVKSEKFLALADVRKTDTKQLWIAGCSMSHGDGVELTQRYGQLIANSLNLPVSFLTNSCTSITWAADQILRSDIRPGDTVVWGLTSYNRINYFGDNIKHIIESTYLTNPKLNNTINFDRLSSDDTLYHAVISIFQVINFCRKLQVNLIIANLLDETLPKYLVNEDCFIMLYGLFGVDSSDQFLDLGTDNQHPGPLTHRYYADKILEKLNDKT